MRRAEGRAVFAVPGEGSSRDAVVAAALRAGLEDAVQAVQASSLMDPVGPGGIFVIDADALGEGALEAISSLRKRRRNVPLEVIAISDDARLAEECVEAGADDFARRRELDAELWIRLKAALSRLGAEERVHGEMEYYKRAVMQEEALSSGLVDLSVAIKDSEEAVAQVRRALRKANRALEAKDRDPLSGLLNRAGLMERIDEAVVRASAANVDVSGLMIDIDRFKTVNDEHGHLAGDAVLSAVGRRLATGLRKDDFAGRWGGEEFFAVLVGTPRDGAIPIAKRIKESVARLSVRKGEDSLAVTVSIGIAEYRPEEGVEDWLKRADDAMYEAKRAGRNSVSWA